MQYQFKSYFVFQHLINVSARYNNQDYKMVTVIIKL